MSDCVEGTWAVSHASPLMVPTEDMLASEAKSGGMGTAGSARAFGFHLLCICRLFISNPTP